MIKKYLTNYQLHIIVLVVLLFFIGMITSLDPNSVNDKRSTKSHPNGKLNNQLTFEVLETLAEDTEDSTHEEHSLCWPVSAVGCIFGWHTSATSEFAFLIILLIICAALFKMVYITLEHFLDSKLPQKYHFHKYIPESAWVILLGVILGAFFKITGTIEQTEKAITFNSEVFFLFLIPPIILHAGYFLNQKFFFGNLGLILVYAVLGTLLNMVLCSAALFGFAELGIFWTKNIGFWDVAIFSSFMSAVDPVAVLAIFEELHVNETLNILVFGESVLNDAVSIVLYRLFESIRDNVYRAQVTSFGWDFIALGLLKFLYVSLGGLSIGIVIGLLCCFLTRFTKNTPNLEPLLVLIFGFLAYFLAESLLLSGIVSIMFCGAVMARYVELNIGKKSHIVIKHGLEIVAGTSENLMFVYLGVSWVVHPHVWDPVFILCALGLMLLIRYIIIYTVTIIDNLLLRKRKEWVSLKTMFVVAFGGLRGAIAFGLAFIMPTQIGDTDVTQQRNMMLTTIQIIISFTIVIQGTLMRPLLSCLKIRGLHHTQKILKEKLRGEHDFLHVERREVQQALADITYFKQSIKRLPKGSKKELQDFQMANQVVIRKTLLGIINHVSNIINDLENMNKNITQLMRLDATDKSHGIKNANEVLAWREEKAESIRKTWRKELDSLAVSDRIDAFMDLNNVMHHLRSNQFQLSCKPQEMADYDEDEFEEDDEEAEINGLGSVSNDNTTFFERTSFLEILQLHDFLHFTYDSYYIVNLARDDDYLFYLDRTLLLESMISWQNEAEELLNSNDFEKVLTLLQYLDNLIRIQIENREKELAHLHNEDFASVVFGFGIRQSSPIVRSIAKKSTLRDRWKRVLTSVDKLIQKIVVRGLHSAEQKLVMALSEAREIDTKERIHRDTNIAFDEIVVGNNTKLEKLRRCTMMDDESNPMTPSKPPTHGVPPPKAVFTEVNIIPKAVASPNTVVDSSSTTSPMERSPLFNNK
mmetsp:Transcript_1540/g.2298  ORF Transcript_1540/g.2298 Transcript_1540/m.2298 type:complete len:982 (+) Transcript_1540:143-3088(+)